MEGCPPRAAASRGGSPRRRGAAFAQRKPGRAGPVALGASPEFDAILRNRSQLGG